MHVAYCLALFPNRSETFLLREIRGLRRSGLSVSVWALGQGITATDSPCALGRTVYRPSWRSLRAWQAIAWLLMRRPHRGPIVLACLVQVAVTGSLRSALALTRNLHAVAFFARDGFVQDVAVVHGGFMNLPGLVAMTVALVIDRPLTVAGHARDLFVEGDACRLLGRRSRAMVVCHDSARRWLARHLDERDLPKLRLIHHGLETERYGMRSSADFHPDSRPPRILAVGRLVEKKGFAILIASCQRLAAQGIPFELHIVGDGPDRQRLARLAHEMHVADRITFAGWQNEQSLSCLLARGRVLVVPSIVAPDGDRDGIPNVVLEACAARLPVVATRLGGITEVIEDQVTGLLVRPGDPEGLSRALAEILTDKVLAVRLAASAENRIKARFDLRVTLRRWVRLFQEVRHVRRAA
jgi:colanic acid/amylovoran biosynthesis glycosyltransferase